MLFGALLLAGVVKGIRHGWLWGIYFFIMAILVYILDAFEPPESSRRALAPAAHRRRMDIEEPYRRHPCACAQR
jgi:hypothetical protein